MRWAFHSAKGNEVLMSIKKARGAGDSAGNSLRQKSQLLVIQGMIFNSKISLWMVRLLLLVRKMEINLPSGIFKNSKEGEREP